MCGLIEEADMKQRTLPLRQGSLLHIQLFREYAD